MGFSVTIASAIVLIGFLAIFASFNAALFQGVKELSHIAEDYVSREREKIDVNLQLTVDAVDATSCNVTVKNIGSKTIFLKSQNGFSWNTLMVSYGNGSNWQSYPIEDYEILDIKVTGTNSGFNPANHSFVNSGEEARLTFSIPNGAPEIPEQAVVSVTFASHYGVTASGEAVREQ
jgi:archaellum component FlaF (FlaF/FlaG flagellin family)